MPSRFQWVRFDVADLLPQNWQADVLAVAANADFRDFPRTPILTREAADVLSIRRGRVHANQVKERLPWLGELYHGPFHKLAEDAWAELALGSPETVVTAEDQRYGLVLNVQRGTEMRFECHVDSNPLTGLLFCTDHPKGGELVISNDTSAHSVAEVEKNCEIIRPTAGHLIFFDVRRHPHYSRELLSDSEIRVLADMNFYTESFPESTRPKELNRHLYGDPA
jgi:hypothetical protein